MPNATRLCGRVDIAWSLVSLKRGKDSKTTKQRFIAEINNRKNNHLFRGCIIRPACLIYSNAESSATRAWEYQLSWLLSRLGGHNEYMSLLTLVISRFRDRALTIPHAHEEHGTLSTL